MSEQINLGFLHQDNQRTAPVGIQPDTLTRGCLITGTSGSGKSTAAVNLIDQAAAATDGATIVIDPANDGMAKDAARAIYARQGTFEDVYYFDCSEAYPRLSFFDVRGLVADGIGRRNAATDIATRVADIIRGVMDTDDEAIEAMEVIKALIIALFDPVEGTDAFTLSKLTDALATLRATQEFPAVTVPEAIETKTTLEAMDSRTFDRVCAGASTRLKKLSADPDVRPLFEHVADSPATADTSVENLSYCALGALLDEDVTLLFDLGDIVVEDRQQRIVRTLLAVLWQAFTRRRRRYDPAATPPRVPVIIDEVATLGVGDMLKRLLSQGRGYGLCTVPILQFPAQLEEDDHRAYLEILNDCATVLAGQLDVPEAIATKLAGQDWHPNQTAQRLMNLDDDEFLFRPAVPHSADQRGTIRIKEPPLPRGHPDGPKPLHGAAAERFDLRLTECQARTRQQFGARYDARTPGPDGTESDPQRPVDLPIDSMAVLLGTVDYDPTAGRLICQLCHTDYEYSAAGLQDSVTCCRDPDTILGPIREASPTQSRVADDRPFIQLVGQALTDHTRPRHQPRRDTLPERVAYVPTGNSYVCQACAADDDGPRPMRYPVADGPGSLRRALRCCDDLLAGVDREAIRRIRVPAVPVSRATLAAFPDHPVLSVEDLRVDAETAEDVDLTLQDARFLQALYLAVTDTFDELLEFSLVHDSMTVIRDDLGLSRGRVETLERIGLVTVDDHPHTFYSPTKATLRLLYAPWKQRHEWGDGINDLSVTAQHTAVVEAMRRRYEAQYATDPGVEVRPFEPVASGGTVDLAVRDTTDDTLLAVAEIERANDDTDTSPLETYQKLAPLDCPEKRWIVESGSHGQTVQNTLARHGTATDDSVTPTIDYSKTGYSSTTAFSDYGFSEPGITSMERFSDVYADLTPPWATESR